MLLEVWQAGPESRGDVVAMLGWLPSIERYEVGR
jgi:hypothetical protein